ncbi:uncharacterized protein LOC130545272 [Triplophysa rosa]|uniref:uncharacterized protein LOC130545272 n=1 Tax=Triplophysa rosa TaxID=992332 RepID=UPI002545FC70|nr:uncharacterized protein LOC130545272 [Triplophysa rosa]
MAACFQAGMKREPHEREMSVSRQDDDDDEVLSDVEPLPPSALHQSSLVTRSWPSSPLAASHEVTAGLYRSLQRSRQREVIGHTAARPVSFMSSPDLTAVRATPPLYSHGLKEAREAGHIEDSSHDVIGSGVQEVESEGDGRLHEMDLHLQKSLNRSAQRTSGRRHVEEMENVRTHLQSILRSTSTAPHRHGEHTSHHITSQDMFVMFLTYDSRVHVPVPYAQLPFLVFMCVRVCVRLFVCVCVCVCAKD